MFQRIFLNDKIQINYWLSENYGRTGKAFLLFNSFNLWHFRLVIMLTNKWKAHKTLD